MAEVYKKQQRYTEALDLLEQIERWQDTIKKICGQTRNVGLDLAELYDLLGRNKEAEALYLENLQWTKEKKREAAWRDLIDEAYKRLATFYRKIGRIQDAETMDRNISIK